MQPLSRPLVCLALIAVLLASLAACSGGSAGGQTDPTVAALASAVAATATAAESGSGDVDKLATAQFEATQGALDVQATRTAQAVGRSEEELQQATVAAPIVAELPRYGVDTTQGRTGWVHDPLTLDVNGYQQYAYGNDHPEVIAADFVLAADILWDTQYGSSGCGFLFRSDGDQDKPNAYMVLMSRFANGRVIFSATADGEIANMHDFYPKDADRNFQWQNGTTNRLAIVARGNLIEIYTNGVKIGEIDTTLPPEPLGSPPKPMAPLDPNDANAAAAYQAQLAEYQDIMEQSEASFTTAKRNYAKRQAIFDQGFIQMFAGSQSGHTACTFDKAWLWLIEE